MSDILDILLNEKNNPILLNDVYGNEYLFEKIYSTYHSQILYFILKSNVNVKDIKAYENIVFRYDEETNQLIIEKDAFIVSDIISEYHKQEKLGGNYENK